MLVHDLYGFKIVLSYNESCRKHVQYRAMAYEPAVATQWSACSYCMSTWLVHCVTRRGDSALLM